MTAKRIIVIPARYQSGRLAVKLLQDLHGKTVLEHTIEKGLAAGLDELIVAIDDERIGKAIEHLPIKVVMTKDSHQSGTERIAEVIDTLKIDAQTVIVNLQADEPFMHPLLLKQVAENLLQHSTACMATLYEPIEDPNNIFNPNIVKVAINKHGFAQYFSRAPIPWFRDGFANQQIKQGLSMPDIYKRHIGLYAYRAGFIQQYISLAPAPWEEIEKLEQLRVLWHGFTIHIEEAKFATSIGIDTKEDLELARTLLAK